MDRERAGQRAPDLAIHSGPHVRYSEYFVAVTLFALAGWKSEQVPWVLAADGLSWVAVVLESWSPANVLPFPGSAEIHVAPRGLNQLNRTTAYVSR